MTAVLNLAVFTEKFLIGMSLTNYKRKQVLLLHKQMTGSLSRNFIFSIFQKFLKTDRQNNITSYTDASRGLKNGGPSQNGWCFVL